MLSDVQTVLFVFLQTNIGKMFVYSNKQKTAKNNSSKTSHNEYYVKFNNCIVGLPIALVMILFFATPTKLPNHLS